MERRDKAIGRPRRDELREAMGTVTFRIDDAAKQALDALAADLPIGTVGRRSIILRKLIMDAFVRRR